MPGTASLVYITLGNMHQRLGDFSKAIEYHTKDLEMVKQRGDRQGEQTHKRCHKTPHPALL